jgi:UrcA family protein
MQRFTRTFSLALGVAAAFGFSGFANAESVGAPGSQEPRQVELAYSDLDLSRTDHATELYSRIAHAARGVCTVNTVPNPQALLIERKCAAKAVEDAVHSIDNANLTAVFLAKSGKRAMVASNR